MKIGLESLFKLSILISMIDNVSKPAGMVQKTIDETVGSVEKMNKTFSDIGKQGAAMAALGAGLMNQVLAPVQATFETQAALGELRSVGVTDLEAVENAALHFSNTWAGTVKPDFIAAAYDIKSGIASLSDEGVAGYTEIAALTARATKSSVAEMTSLFATGYGIYKDYYEGLTDLEFAELFSAGIATSVRQFKTTGSGMAQSIQSLGAAASNAKVPMEEQLSILGMLQQTMSGSEAGTKYRAFLKSAASAGDQLGLTFMDANNQLLSMPEILSVLKGRFGDTLDAVEKLQLQKAFGTEEAVALIDLLYPKVGGLEDNILLLYDSMQKGTQAATEMAQVMTDNPGSQWETLTQQGHNLSEMIGDTMAPTMDGIVGSTSNLILSMQQWVQEHPTLTRWIMTLLTILAVLGISLGSLMVTIGVGGMAVSKLSLYWGVLRGAFMGALPAIGSVTAGVWSFTLALLANPITWIVIGVVALIAALYLLWYHFDWVREKVSGLSDEFLYVLSVIAPFLGIPLLIIKYWDQIPPWFRDLFTGMRTGFEDFANSLPQIIMNKLGQFRESGAAIMRTFGEGIRSMINVPGDAIRSGLQKIRNMLPFSDAREGPLSALTLNGRKVFETIAAGMPLGLPTLLSQTEQGFEDLTAAGGKTVTRSLMGGGYKRMSLRGLAESQSTTVERVLQAKGGGSTTNQVIINVERIEEVLTMLKAFKDLQDFVESTGGAPA